MGTIITDKAVLVDELTRFQFLDLHRQSNLGLKVLLCDVVGMKLQSSDSCNKQHFKQHQPSSNYTESS